MVPVERWILVPRERSSAAGVVTPSIVGSATFKTSDTSTVSQAHPRQGPPDDQVFGARVPAEGESVGH